MMEQATPVENNPPDVTQLSQFLPEELMRYFSPSGYNVLCDLKTKQEFWVIEFEEKNQLPHGYSSAYYASTDFFESKLLPGFTLENRHVFLNIKKRKWLRKASGEVIWRYFSFMAKGAKLSRELTEFLKEATTCKIHFNPGEQQLA